MPETMVPWDATLQTQPDHPDYLGRGCPPGMRIQFTDPGAVNSTMVPVNLLETFRLIYDLDFAPIGLRCVGLYADVPYDTNPPVQPTPHEFTLPDFLPSMAGINTFMIVAVVGFLVIKFSDFIPTPRR